ncbi:8070_t:CDS:2 [Rhizophagus irregularis]|nr:8070_t:CDS:2 [Rhizophagus irregularis]
MSSFLRIDDYESYEKPNNDFTNLNQHSNKRVLDKISTRKDIISHAPSTPSYTSHIPSPFVMSQCRRSCVMHQQLFFRNDTFNNVRNHGRQDLTSTITTPVNDKRSHANLLHDRWNCRWKKDVVSQRLGISYKESYLARTKGLVIHHVNKQMYRKWLDTFSEHNRLDTMKHQLITAQRYRFLFLPSQYIYKPIKYLQYTHGLDYPDYGFKIPYNQEITPKKDLLIYTVEQYNPIPNGFFPSKYKDIIPKKPLYTASGEFIIPGSREWFTYMYKLDLERKSTPPPSRSSLEERQQLLVKENDRIQDLIKGKGKQEAALHGTSYHHQNMSNLASRYSMMEGNINFQLKLYQEMTTFNDAFNLGKSISVIPPMTNDELYVPSKGGRYYINNPSQ